MRHGKKFNHLSRPAAHRKALLVNLAKSLILQKRIQTTVAKAKALKKFVEPILTKAKLDTTHSRRVVFSYFQDKAPVKELFNDIATRIAQRPGGYTRIIKLGTRLGDNAEMCMIELVDYNELLQKTSKPEKAKTRRGRSKAKETQQDAKVAADAKAPAAEAAQDSTPSQQPAQDEAQSTASDTDTTTSVESTSQEAPADKAEESQG